MSRRDEREIARQLAGQPGGEPPSDLLARLQADLPPRLAVAAEAAARRRPAALGRRWLLAASLAAMTGAGLVSLHTLRTMTVPPLPEPLRPAAGSPAGGSVGAADPAGTQAADALARKRAAAPAPAPDVESAAPLAAAGGVAGAAPPATAEAPPLLDRPAGGPEGAGAAPPPVQAVPTVPELQPRGGPAAGLAAPSGPSAERPLRLAGAAKPTGREEARLAAEAAALPGVAGSAGSAAPELSQQNAVSPVSPSARSELEKMAASRDANAAAAEPSASPSPRAKAEAKSARRADAPQPPAGVVGGLVGRDFAAREPGSADGVAEVQAFAAPYDSDAAADAAGWSLVAAATPPPPPIGGSPATPAAGTRWVRWRLRAPAALAGEVRVEISWSSAAVERRRMGGAPSTEPQEVYSLPAEALRRGWTAAYEVRFEPSAVRPLAGPLARLRVVAPGSPEREVHLALADFSPSWRQAPAAVRLPLLAAAFAERRRRGDESLSDLIAAARSLAAATGDRRADDLVQQMLAISRPRPAAPPPS